MSIALFGETARLGGKNFAFINNTKKEAFVELTFDCEGQYTVKRYYKQKQNSIESTAMLINEKATIAEGVRDVNAKIYEIIQMNASDYSKCIALPQGEFAAFLKSSAAERTALIGKLFGLEQYGDNLIKSANTKKSLLEQQCEMLKHQISSLGENLPSEITSLEQEQNTIQEKIASLSKQLKEQENQFQLQARQKEENAKYIEIAEKLQKLNENSEQILQKRQQLERHNLAAQSKSQLQELKQSLEIQIELSATLKTLEKEFELANFDLSSANRTIDEINKRAKTVSESDQIIIELKQLVEKEEQAKQLNEQIAQINSAIESNKTEIEKNKNQATEELQIIEKDQNRLNELKSKIDACNLSLSKIEKLGGAEGAAARKEALQMVLSNLMQTFEDVQNQNKELTQSISANTNKIKENQSKISTVLFELTITDINESLKKNENLLYRLNSAQKQLNFTSEQNQIIQNSQNKLTMQKNAAQAELKSIEQNISSLYKSKQESEANLKAISDARDADILQNAESTVASRSEIGTQCPICGNTISRIFADQNPNTTYYNNSLLLAKKEHDQLLLKIKALEIQAAETKYIIEQLEKQSQELQQRQKSLQDLNNQILIEFVNITENSLADFNQLLQKTEKDQKFLQKAEADINELNSTIQILNDLNTKNGIYFEKNNEILEIIQEKCEIIRKKIAENEFNRLENPQNSNLETTKESLKFEQDLLNKQILALTKEIEIHKANHLLLNQKIATTTEKISDLNTQKQTIEKQILAFKITFDKLCHGYSSANDKLEKVLAAKLSIEKDSAAASEALKSATIKLIESQKNLDIARNMLNLKNTEISRQKTALAGLFSHFSTQNIDDILQHILPSFAQLESEISAYDQQKSLLEYELSKLNMPETINQTDFSSQIQATKIEISTSTKALGKLGEQIESKKAQICKQNQLKIELENCNNMLKTSTELCSLLRGKELLAYATDAYLQDITQKASSKLYSLLSGKYTLIYENKEFYVLDNLNGAAARSCSTLSGGETFVVSLSLALAISETILAHSARPLEFFFLDEGFGTLDAELRDVIIETLIKLNETGITIGLISHVEELKTEIKSRIVIERVLDEFGSPKSVIHFEQDI